MTVALGFSVFVLPASIRLCTFSCFSLILLSCVSLSLYLSLSLSLPPLPSPPVITHSRLIPLFPCVSSVDQRTVACLLAFVDVLVLLLLFCYCCWLDSLLYSSLLTYLVHSATTSYRFFLFCWLSFRKFPSRVGMPPEHRKKGCAAYLCYTSISI